MKDTVLDFTSVTERLSDEGSATDRPTSDRPAADRPAFERPTDYTIYKPNSRGSGGAIRFGLNRAKASLFVEAAAQSGEKQFDWERKIIMKWNLTDLGSALAGLQGRIPQAKLFHQSEKANSAFELTRQEDPDRAPYLLSISRQDSTDKSLRKVTLPLSHGEAAVLESVLHAAAPRLLGW